MPLLLFFSIPETLLVGSALYFILSFFYLHYLSLVSGKPAFLFSKFLFFKGHNVLNLKELFLIFSILLASHSCKWNMSSYLWEYQWQYIKISFCSLHYLWDTILCLYVLNSEFLLEPFFKHPANFLCVHLSLECKTKILIGLTLLTGGVVRCLAGFSLENAKYYIITYIYIKKAERQRIDAFELWCWTRLLRVPWTARRSNQSVLKEISPEYVLEELTPWKRPWCCERLKAEEGDDRG